MAEFVIDARFTLKHDTEANWHSDANKNFVPKQAELILYDKDANHDYYRAKIGDGHTTIYNLEFAGVPSVNGKTGIVELTPEDIGACAAIDDTQASADHPWSGQKINSLIGDLESILASI